MRITPLFDVMQFTASGPNSLWIMGAGRLLLAVSRSSVPAFQRLLWRKQPLKSSTPESPIAVIQILNVIGCKVPFPDFNVRGKWTNARSASDAALGPLERPC